MSRADFSEHTMPSGAVVFYRDEDHSYWQGIEPRCKRDPDGEWKGCGKLTGVSTVASPFDFRPDALMRWAAKTNGIGIAILAERALSLEDPDEMRSMLEWLRDDRTIWEALERESLTFNDVKEQAAERGTNVHKHALYELSVGNPIPNYQELTDDEHGYAQGIASFWLDHDPEPINAETVVVDTGLGVAGRLDLRAHLRASCGDETCPCSHVRLSGVSGLGDVVLLDAKTSGFIPTKHHVQVAGYDHCAQVSGYGKSDHRWILQVDENGGYELIPVHADATHFRAAIEVYRGAAEINTAASKDRKARQR